MTTENGIIVGVGAAALLLLAVWFVRRRRRRAAARRRTPTGYGAAIALALDGHFSDAASRLEVLLREGAVEPADAAVGLVAVHRAAGRLGSAEAVLEGLVRQGVRGAWLDALRLRVALDRGDVAHAVKLVEAAPNAPTDLALAALCRAGRWADALRLYRDRLGRKARSAEVEGALLAGVALMEAGAGNTRAARKTLKRADGVLADLAGAWIHPKPDERARATRAIAGALGSGTRTLLPGSGIEEPGLDAHGDIEVELGALRDAVERDPQDWRARRAYVGAILEHGEAADWRHELAELLDFVAPVDEAPPALACGACGYVVPEPLFLCPRCDALGSFTVAPATAGSSGRSRPSVEGAKMSDLLANLRRFGPGGPG